MDPLDSIPFADEDPVTLTLTPAPTITAPTAVLQNPSSVGDAGDSAGTSRESEPLPAPADDAGLPENGSEQTWVATESSDVQNGESAKDASDSSMWKPVEEDTDENQKFDRSVKDTSDSSMWKPVEEDTDENQKSDLDNSHKKSDNESQEPFKTEPRDIADSDRDASDGVDDDVKNGDAQRTSDDVTDGQTPLLTSERGGKDGDDGEGEGAVAEGRCPDEQPEDTMQPPAEAALVHTAAQSDSRSNDLSVSQEGQLIATVETKQTGTDGGSVDLLDTMDPQGETHGGTTATSFADDLMDDFFGTTSASETVTNGVKEDATKCILHIDEGIDSIGRNGSTSGPGLGKEGSPEIIVGSVDSVENVTLKDATSEKALMGNQEEDGSSLQRDSLSSRTDEEKRKSSSDYDIDFDVLELDASHLNIDISKQKTSLRKKGSLARRKKPTRGNVTQMAFHSCDSMFQDSTDSKPVTSLTSDTAEDEVFDKVKAAQSQQTEPTSTRESYTVRKAAQPFKPSLIMPGLQDLSKSKLFNQERKKSDECPTSPVKSVSSPLSPTHRPSPPVVLPKPTSKIQKDSQNKTIAAENSSQSCDMKTEDRSNVSNNSVTASVEEESVVSKELHSDSASSTEGPKPARSDSGALTGPRVARTDSWSSVSSPRTLSRRESTSSIEGGEGEGGPVPPTTRRASIQGCAYTPIGFRPRRSSSIVLDSNNKLVDLPTPASPTSASPSSLEKESEALISSGVKSPIYTPPAWLSEMKAKTGISSADFSARHRSTSVGSNEGSAVSTSSGRSRNSSESAEGGGQGQSATCEVTQAQKKQEEEEEPEKPSWMKAPQQKTSHPPEKLPDVEENGDDEETRPPPPWAADLKKKNRPFVSPRISDIYGERNGKTPTSPHKAASEKENTPVANSAEVSPTEGRDEYSPSWMKTSQQGKKPPPPAIPTKPTVSIGSKPTVKAPPVQNPMKQYETPKWKLELAEKKKKREAEMMPTIESGNEPADNSVTDSSDSGVPQWRHQLSQRKKLPQPDVVKDAEAENEGHSLDLAKRAEERRARLMKSGLFDQAQATEDS